MSSLHRVSGCAAAALGCTQQTTFEDGLLGDGEGEAESEAVPGGGDPGGTDGDGTDDTDDMDDRGGFAVDFGEAASGDEGEGVTVNPSGDLVLDPEESLRIFPYIWISNSGEHTVSKLDTETGQELGRYRTGPGGDDPSRTSVGLNGDVVVGNRGGNAAVRIHAEVETCPDRNGNGVIETSTGPGDVLPWDGNGDGAPDDECVLWYTPLPGAYVRAVAFDYQVGADGELSSGVWIGGWNTSTLYKLDAQTGAVAEELRIPAPAYGMAFDGEGNLWVQARSAGMLIQVNTDTLAVTTYPAESEGYGVTVDAEGRPVIATYGSAHVNRFDPATGAWATATLPDNGRGVAVARDGAIWATGHNTGMFRVDPDTMTVTNTVPVGCCAAHVGAAVDQAGKVWVVSQGGSTAYRIDPDTFAVDSFPVGSWPYTYSDMTGAQLENAAPPLGRLTSILEGCGQKQQWSRLEWEADTPGGTWVRFRGRTAQATTGLGNAPWTILAEQPDDASPVDLIPILDAPGASGSFGRVMQLEITMGAVQPGITPRLRDLRVHATCGGDLD